jgi:alpha-tubulin suppressor-like RCC1 family protein
VYVPARVGKDNDWLTAIAMQHIIFAIKKNGTLWVWGRKGGSDIRGFQTSTDVTTTPTQVGTDTNWKHLFVQKQHQRAAIIGIKQDGSLWAWGQNRSGKLGIGDEDYRQLPTPLKLNGQWQSFAIADEYSIAVNADGSLWHSGNFLKWTDAKAGDITKSNIFQKTKLPGKWRSVHFMQMSGVVLVDDKGDVYTYGINGRGELGQGIKTSSWKPGLVKL